MRRLISGSLVFAFCITAPVLSAAQGRVPHAESTALGFDIGAFVPKSDQLDSGGLMSVTYDYYVTPRVSLRSSFGWTNQEFDTAAPDSLRQMPLKLDVNYNWEGGQWHPFVGAGLGAYFMQFRSNGQTIGDTETKFGANLGGGVEYFFNRTVAFKGEGRYHAVQEARGVKPSGFSLTAGLKTYF